MFDRMKAWIKEHPATYDFLKAIARHSFARNDPTYVFFQNFSARLGKTVRFIQIGANDGLRNDPIREFIIRDRWEGVLVEPLPGIFELLVNNYPSRLRDRLHFVNAAISDTRQPLPFWSYREAFLRTLSLEERLFYLRKASFDKAHVERFLPPNLRGQDIVEKIEVACLTVNDLIDRYFHRDLDLLVIDAEGHEDTIISSIDFAKTRPAGIFFESHNLAQRKSNVVRTLEANGYRLTQIAGDTAATLPSA